MILRTLFLHPLGPVIMLALAIFLLALGQRLVIRRILRAGISGSRLEDVARAELLMLRLRLPVALLFVAGAAALLLGLRANVGHTVLQWTWQPLTVAGSVLEWRLDGWNLLAALLVLALTAVALLIPTGQVPLLDVLRARGSTARRSLRFDRLDNDIERTLGLAAAAVLFVCSGNVITLAAAWVVLDTALAVRLRPDISAEPAGRTWSALSLAGLLPVVLLGLLGEQGIRTSLAGDELSAAQWGLLWLAALVRAGVYPLHFWLTSNGALARGGRVALSLMTPTAGLWLLARSHAAASPDWLRRPEWVALGALALLGTALAAWATDDDARRWRWVALNRASVMVMAAYMSAPAGPEALAWPLITFALGCGLLALGQAAREELAWRAPAAAAALLLWGVPGSPGFLARWALVFPTGLPMAVPLFAIVVLAEALLVASLWQMVFGPVTPAGALPAHAAANSRVRLGVALAIVGLPALLWGVAPGALALVGGWTSNELFPPLGALLAEARRSVWAGLGLSAVMGAALGLVRGLIFGGMRGWQRGVVTVVSLEWLYQLAAAGWGLAASGLQYFSTLGEGEGYLGWLLLVGLILWALLRG